MQNALLAAAMAYFICAVFGASRLRSKETFLSFAIWIPITLHTVGLLPFLHHNQTYWFGFGNILSLIGLLTISVAFMVRWFWTMNSRTLVLTVVLFACLTSLTPLLWPTNEPTYSATLSGFWLHTLIGFLSYALLALAALQAALLLITNNRLHKHAIYIQHQEPSFLTLEGWMLRFMTAGFVLLTLTLLSGLIFSQQVFGKPFAWTHKVVFGWTSWLIMAFFWLGHWRFGWRGVRAARWTLAAFVFLILAYIGVKFVVEVLQKS